MQKLRAGVRVKGSRYGFLLKAGPWNRCYTENKEHSMKYELNESLYKAITQICLDSYNGPLALAPVQLMEEIWTNTDFPMHCPEHHYLIPAVLLTAYHRLKNHDKGRLKEDLKIAAARSRNILAGFCGLYGACGAAVGSGVFLSVFTDTTPYSTDTWGLVNQITAKCLEEIAGLGGPRCCKRVCFSAVIVSAGFMKENMKLDIGDVPPITCGFHDQNAECKKLRCPFHQGEAGESS